MEASKKQHSWLLPLIYQFSHLPWMMPRDKLSRQEAVISESDLEHIIINTCVPRHLRHMNITSSKVRRSCNRLRTRDQTWDIVLLLFPPPTTPYNCGAISDFEYWPGAANPPRAHEALSLLPGTASCIPAYDPTPEPGKQAPPAMFRG